MSTTSVSKNVQSKTPAASIIFYILAVVLCIAAAAFLIREVLFYRSSVDQYVAQGYTQAEVAAQLGPQQLFPDIFQSVLMFGVSALLWGAGLINTKAAKVFGALTFAETHTESEVIADSVEIGENAFESENTEVLAKDMVEEDTSVEEEKPQV